MAEKNYLNKGTSSYFPGDAPTYFSYTLDFATGGSRHNLGMIHVAGTAWKKLSGDRMAYHQTVLDNPEVIIHLKALAQGAKDSELAFLQKYGITMNGNDWGALIRTFTELYTSKDIFERNLQLLTQVEKGQTTIYHYFTSHFGGYLRDAVDKLVPQSGLVKGTTAMDAGMKTLMYDIIEEALKKMFSMTDAKFGNGYIETNWRNRDAAIEGSMAEELRALESLKSMISRFKNNQFLSGLNEIWDLENLVLDMINGTNNAKTKIVYDVHSSGKKGTVQEYFEQVLAGEVDRQLNGLTVGNQNLWLTFGAKNGGTESGVKSDVTSTNVGAEAASELKLIDDNGKARSKRVNSIKNYKAWFDKWKEAEGDIVFISDKNYQIKSNFKGFAAQDGVTLRNLEALLSEVGTMGGDNITSLIDFLANCGKDMLLGARHSEVMDSIATQIGNFLFDDLEITVTAPGLNRIHILNLSGFYVPLSVYLEGLIDAIINTREDMKGFVNISFHAAGSDGAASPWHSKEDFNDFRDIQLDNSLIDVHFMRNFAQFITSHISI